MVDIFDHLKYFEKILLSTEIAEQIISFRAVAGVAPAGRTGASPNVRSCEYILSAMLLYNIPYTRLVIVGNRFPDKDEE